MKTLTSTLAALALGAAWLVAEEAPELQYVPLFNGTDLSGWVGEGYEVQDGTLVCTPTGGALRTESTYSNYVLDFEFKLPPGGNNGIGIHYSGQGDPSKEGMEIQILDNTAEKHADLKEAQLHGSIYMMVPGKKDHMKPIGEWNRQRIIVHGSTVRVELNGEVITEENLNKLENEFSDHQGVKRRSGHIALCGHKSPVAFRNLNLCELPPVANVEGATKAGFKPIFDGITLEGWDLRDGPEGHWKAINGILKFDGEGKDLWSKESYGDFSLAFDWRWSEPGPLRKRPVIGPDGKETGKQVEVQELDSGIYLRGSSKSQVNLWNWPVGSGEVYGYRTDEKQPAEIRAGVTPQVKADLPLGEWNRMLIQVKGDRLTVALNGRKVIVNAQLPGMSAEGPIALQSHGAAIDFANLYLRED